jgi:hypothetical protein
LEHFCQDFKIREIEIYLNNIAGSVSSFENPIACETTNLQVDFFKNNTVMQQLFALIMAISTD